MNLIEQEYRNIINEQDSLYPEMSAKDVKDLKILFFAVRTGETKLLDILCDSKNPIPLDLVLRPNNISIVYVAVHMSHIEMLKRVIFRLYDSGLLSHLINMPDDSGLTPIKLACLHANNNSNSASILKLLLDYGAVVREPDTPDTPDTKKYADAIFIAINSQNAAAVQILLSHNEKEWETYKNLTKLPFKTSNIDIPVDYLTLRYNNWTPIIYAAYIRNHEIMRILLDHLKTVSPTCSVTCKCPGTKEIFASELRSAILLAEGKSVMNTTEDPVLVSILKERLQQL
jgi:ankyrin repeat protein